MASTHYRQRSDYDETPLRRRAGALALAVGLNLLILLALLGIQASKRIPKSFTDSLVVDLLPDSPSPAPRATTAVRPKATPPRIPRVKPPPIASPFDRPLEMIELRREDYAAADIARLPSGAGSGSGTGRGDSEEVGRGPNGQILYAAEWARRPTNAELGGYMPPNAPEGWGMVACRTVAGHRVEDCVELENHPRGSRLAGAVRQAAWQFRVRPPRKNGRELVGEWVRIRIDYYHQRIR